MSDVFPKWTNKLPVRVIVGAILAGVGATAGLTYYFTPKYTRVGYQPVQPVAFSHAIHVNQLGLDCRYCHTHVDKSWYSNVPSTSTCMNCHSQVLKADPRLELVRRSHENGTSIPWVQIHKTPDYVYFNHAVHVNRGISCVKCHGQVNEMDEVYHAKPFSMAFCLECHRNPAEHIRPADKVTDLTWQWSHDPELNEQLQKQKGRELVHSWKVMASENCSACHR
jgi:hypothetical protein